MNSREGTAFGRADTPPHHAGGFRPRGAVSSPRGVRAENLSAFGPHTLVYCEYIPTVVHSERSEESLFAFWRARLLAVPNELRALKGFNR